MELDEELLNVYFKALERGHEYAKHIRLMVVGMYHVGKTTLVHKLLNKPDAEQEHPSTVGIDISVDACEIDENGKWEITEFQDKENGYILRLQELFESDKTAPKDRQSAPTETIYNRNEQKTHQAQDVVMELEENPADKIKERRTQNLIDICMNELKEEAEKKKLTGSTPYYNEIKQANRNALQPNVAIKRPTISMWDFAGQSVYYSTHHFFLNPRAIYLLVLDLSKGLNEELNEETLWGGSTNLHLGNSTKHFTQLDAFQFWMRSIYIYTKQKQSLTSTDSTQYQPTIILIGTHKDKVEQEDPDTYAEEYFKTALHSVEDIPGLKDLICEAKFIFGKGESLDKIDELRSKIYQVAKDQPFWNEKISGKFIPLERQVVKKKSDSCQTMRFQELEEVSKDSHYPLKKDEIQVFLKFQHAFGNILYYDRANPDMVILNPQWLIDVFKLFVTHTSKRDSEGLKKLYTYAKLSDRLVDILLKSEGNWIDYKECILKYMEFLDIIAKPVMFKGHKPDEDEALVTPSQKKVKEELDTYRWPVTVTTGETTESEDFHFMPCMLPLRPHADEIKNQLKLVAGESSPVLCMYIGGVFLPPFIFHRILATCIKTMPVLVRNNTYVLYNGLGAFKIDKTTSLTIWSLDNMIYLKVTSCHNDRNTKYGKRRMPNADLTEVRKYFDSLIRKLFHIGGHQLSDKFNIAYYITCPGCPEMFPYARTSDGNKYPIDPLGELFEVEEALQTKDMVCNSNQHNVTQNECLSQWFDTITVLKEIDPALSERLLKKPDSLFLADMADEIDADRIDDLAERLHISTIHKYYIKSDHGHPTLCYIFHILYTWSERKRNSVQLFAVAQQLGCSKQDVIRMLHGTDSDRVKKDIEILRKDISQEKLDNIVLDEDYCRQIGENIGQEYWLLGIRLGLGEPYLQRQSSHYSRNSERIICELLREWLKKSVLPNKEQNEELIRAMVKCECSMDVILEIFKADMADEIDPDLSKKPDSLFLADMADEIDPDTLEHLLQEPDSLFLADMADEIDVDQIDALAEQLDICYTKKKRIKNDWQPILCYIFHILYIGSQGKLNSDQLFKVVSQLGCSKQDFIRMLHGTDSDRVKKDIKRLKDEISQEKLENIVLDEDYCEQIGEDIGQEYWLLGIRLGLGENYIQREFFKYYHNPKQMICYLLRKWLNKSVLPNKEQNEELIRAMVKCECSMDVILEIFKADMADEIDPDLSKKPDSLFPADMADEIDPDTLEHLLQEPDSLFLADMANEIDVDQIDALAEQLDICYKEKERIKYDYGQPVLCYIFHILYIGSQGKLNYDQLFKVVSQLGCSKQDFIRMIDGTDSDSVKKAIERLREEISQEKLDTIVLNKIDFMNIAEDIGQEYWLLGIRLGLEEQFLQRESCTCSRDSITMICIIIRTWLKASELSNKERNEELLRAMVKSNCKRTSVRDIFKK